MKPEQYAVSQAVITAAVTKHVLDVASTFLVPAMSPVQWIRLLELLFPEVQRRYAQAAALARDFYDSQRKLHHPELDRNERSLSKLEWEWFAKNMDGARPRMSQADSPRNAATNLALRAVREVEMGGRRQIIGAVKNDPPLAAVVKNEPSFPTSGAVRGWARVATGKETCAWCLMLISRGPTYLGADTSGLDLDDFSAIRSYRAAGGDLEAFRRETEEYMEQWHAGCDCMVVPVFNRTNWPGLDAQKRALDLWIEAGHEADRLIKAGTARSTDVNKETQNALRRMLSRSDFSMTSYAFAA